MPIALPPIDALYAPATACSADLTRFSAPGYGPMLSAPDAAPSVVDADVLVRELTPGAFSSAGARITGGSQALITGDSSLGACGVLLATVTSGFSGSELQQRCLHTVLAAAAAAGGAPV